MKIKEHEIWRGPRYDLDCLSPVIGLAGGV